MLAVVAVLAYAGIVALLPRVWRVGRISDKSAALILLFNLPVLLMAALAAARVPFWTFALAGVLLLTVPLVFFRFALMLMEQARATTPSNGTMWSGFSRLARWTITLVAVVPSLLFVLVFAWLTYTGRLQV